MSTTPDDGPMRILVVCVGNRCRSPLTERLLQQRLDAVRPGRAVVSSAGTIGPDGRAMDADAAVQLQRLGGDPSGFVSRRLTPQLLADQQLVLTATKDLRQQVIAMSPRLMKRVYGVTELAAIIEAGDLEVEPSALPLAASSRRSAGASAADVPDPINGTEAMHREAADLLAAAVDVIAAALLR